MIIYRINILKLIGTHTILMQTFRNYEMFVKFNPSDTFFLGLKLF